MHTLGNASQEPVKVLEDERCRHRLFRGIHVGFMFTALETSFAYLPYAFLNLLNQ